MLDSTRMRTTVFRFVRFGLVGLSGLAVNSLLLALATDRLKIYYLLSAALATIGSTVWNFGLTEVWVFSDRRGRAGWGWRLGYFFIMNNLALVVVRWPIMYVLTSGLHIHYLVSNVLSIGAVMVLRYTVADMWIWKARDDGAVRGVGNVSGQYHYSIHDIVTITSEVPLPELEPFRAGGAIERPTIRVLIDPTNPRWSWTISAASGPQHLNYDEGLGTFGFRARIAVGDEVEVQAAPLLRWSPHVLYTNLIEPILRWTFVRKGYALVHAACLAFGDKAYLITARTDTGKTTTLLKILRQTRSAADAPAFIADDLTLVSPTGRILTYPKPLTISAHTVRAIDATCLSQGQRAFLPFQSRIHSRTGRRMAHQMARTALPMATVNAVTQAVIPPPKFFVQDLVPGARLAREAQLAGVFVIQREGNEVRRLGADETLQILLENGEDAYGFPPYHTIEGTLRWDQDRDLQAIERDIIASALRGVPGFLIRRNDMDWSTQILASLDGNRADTGARLAEAVRLADPVPGAASP